MLLPGQVGKKHLFPLYEKVNKAIRDVDSKTLLFWEPVTWSHWGFNSRFSKLNQMTVKFFR